MRHLWSLLAGVVIAPVAWAVIAYGTAVTADVQKSGPVTAYDSKLLVAAAVFVGAGLLAGLIGSLRVSPLGPLVAGVVYVASAALLVFTPKTADDIFNRQSDVAGHTVNLLPPLANGIIPVVGAMLLVSVVSAGRWRRWPKDEEPLGAAVAPTSAEPYRPAEGVTEEVTAPTPATSAWPSDSTAVDTKDESPWGPPPSR